MRKLALATALVLGACDPTPPEPPRADWNHDFARAADALE